MTARTKQELYDRFSSGGSATNAISQIEQEFEDLIDSIGVTGSITVAASDASNASKGRADYVCDGTADDVEIAAAIAALPSGRATKARVILSEGNFATVANISVPSYTIIEITGKITHSTTSKCLQIATAATDVEIRGGWIDGGTVASCVHGEGELTNIIVEGVKCTNALLTAQAIYLEGDNIIVENCHIDTAGAGILVGKTEADSGFTASDIRIVNNYVYNTKDDGIALNIGHHAVIANNNVDRNNYSGPAASSAGIKIYGGCEDVTVIGNTVVGCPTTTMGIKTSVETGEDSSPKYCSIVGNVVEAASATTTNGIQWEGLAGGRALEGLIQGNTIRDFANGIYLQQNDGARVEGNNCENCTAGIYVGASVLDTVIKDNKGYVTENSGTSAIASGDTTKVVAHGCATTPTVVNIAFREQGTNDYGRWWVSAIGSTGYTLNVSGDPGASNLDFGWEAKVR